METSRDHIHGIDESLEMFDHGASVHVVEFYLWLLNMARNYPHSGSILVGLADGLYENYMERK